MNLFFSGRTINEDLFNYSDLNAFHDFFGAFVSHEMPWYGFPQYLSIILGGIIFFFFVLFLCIDGFIDAGMLNSIEKGKSGFFLKGMQTHGFSFFKLRLFNLIPYLIAISIVLTPLAYLYIIESFNALIIAFILLSIPFMFILKMIDYGKYLILREHKKAGSAFLISLKSIFKNLKQTLALNIQTLLLFLVGYFLYRFLDDIVVVNTVTKIWFMLILQQATLFGKQILRYSYMTAVGNFNSVDSRI
ncbi:hypothetical protein [Pontimicrobium sp. SW4]|uniref:Beta-carotene 15,15'-monooxygenase n=1 Tax=Pontimicrobium sp. SW4 TaxID=3153519 RepID=A0AAU7BP74_9FLAO